ncbi:MAG: NADH-quinone oxidoreductase subunit N [Burkholderiales bacterium]|nr:NADH-quinone oxidoreductase subunit N [Burkholderiales bacterium]
MNWLTIATALASENILLLGIVVLLLVEIVVSRPRGATTLALFFVAAAACAAVLLYATGYVAHPFPGEFSTDPESSLAKSVVLALALPVLLLSRDDFGNNVPYHVLLLSSLYGACLLLSADSFLTVFLGLELLSLPVYVLVLMAHGHARTRSLEAALKYLVLGGTATATFLLAVALLYGGSGSLSLSSFTAAMVVPDPMAIAALILLMIAFFIKAAVVPFHAWAPDAYEGASVPVTAFMATIVKAAILLAVLRIVGAAPLSGTLVDAFAILPLASIVWGNLAAMRQTSFRRMIAYSSIAHAGFLYYALLGDGPGRYQAVLFYVVVYGLMNLLAFAGLPRGSDDASRDRLDRLAGLFHRDRFGALMIGIAMLSLAGIPPLPGFIAKFLVFKNVMAAGYTTYAVLGLVGSYLGIYFYLRVIQLMFMSPGEAAAGARQDRGAAVVTSLVCLIPVLLLAVFPGWVIGRV